MTDGTRRHATGLTDDATLPRLRGSLLSWYEKARRDLPWRRRPSFYHTLLAEFLLQQTRVAQALPYYRRFLREFPTLKRLAAAPFPRVLKLWEGLGYYRRARHLHETARRLANLRRVTAADLTGCPGLGPYTRAAVASIACGAPLAVVDGNVNRVLARVLALVHPPRHREGLLPDLWEFPGGKQEPGETLAETCAREIREELCMTIAVGRELAVVEHAYSHFSVTLHFFACRPVRGHPQARGCQAWRWVRAGELKRLPFPRADRPVVEMLQPPRPSPLG